MCVDVGMIHPEMIRSMKRMTLCVHVIVWMCYSTLSLSSLHFFKVFSHFLKNCQPVRKDTCNPGTVVLKL